MPDVWTTNREHLRDAISGLGGQCGVEARVLKPRDQEWTCYADSDSWQGDVYIHNYFSFWDNPLAIYITIFWGGIGIVIGLLWGKRFWKRAS